MAVDDHTQTDEQARLQLTDRARRALARSGSYAGLVSEGSALLSASVVAVGPLR
jgi:hypothetical protein